MARLAMNDEDTQAAIEIVELNFDHAFAVEVLVPGVNITAGHFVVGVNDVDENPIVFTSYQEVIDYIKEKKGES